MKGKDWFVYIIQNEKGHLYTGITTDLDRRFAEHRNSPKGAKFFRSSAPLDVLFTRTFKDRSQASRFEALVKKLKRGQKLHLIATGELP